MTYWDNHVNENYYDRVKEVYDFPLCGWVENYRLVYVDGDGLADGEVSNVDCSFNLN